MSSFAPFVQFTLTRPTSGAAGGPDSQPTFPAKFLARSKPPRILKGRLMGSLFAPSCLCGTPSCLPHPKSPAPSAPEVLGPPNLHPHNHTFRQDCPAGPPPRTAVRPGRTAPTAAAWPPPGPTSTPSSPPVCQPCCLPHAFHMNEVLQPAACLSVTWNLWTWWCVSEVWFEPSDIHISAGIHLSPNGMKCTRPRMPVGGATPESDSPQNRPKTKEVFRHGLQVADPGTTSGWTMFLRCQKSFFCSQSWPGLVFFLPGFCAFHFCSV